MKFHALNVLFGAFFFLSSQTKNTERDELHDMIRECMDDGPEIPKLRDQVKLTNISLQFRCLRLSENNQNNGLVLESPKWDVALF